MSKRTPRRGDVVYLADDISFTYVERPVSNLDADRFEVLAPDGEAYIVVRAPERDEHLRSAMHDDGERVAWRVAAYSSE